MSGPLDAFLSRAVSDCVEGYAAGIRDDASDVALGKSREERRPCVECGDTHTCQGEACSLCGPPSPAQASPAQQAALFRRTAALMRKQAERARDEQYRQNCLADAHYFERRAAELEP